MNKIVTPEEDAYEAGRTIFEKEAETMSNCELIQDIRGFPVWGTLVTIPTPQGPKQAMVGIHVDCPEKIHKTPRPVMSCKHCIPGQQDEVHPAGIFFMPAGYYLCGDCLKLMERHKLNIPREITLQCSDCVWECIQTIKKINPTLYRNLKDEKKAGA